MSYIEPKKRTDPAEIRARISELHKIARETEWRSTAYRAKVEIIELKDRLKQLDRSGR
jgi:hypothetical protein